MRIFSVKTLVIFTTELVTISANGPMLFLTSLIRSLKALNSCTNAPFCSTKGEINKAPILAKAALIFDNAPVNVSFAFLACSPNASSIAAAKVWKSSLPLLTISRTSASDLCKYVPSVAAAFMPLDERDNKSSPIKRP